MEHHYESIDPMSSVHLCFYFDTSKKKFSAKDPKLIHGRKISISLVKKVFLFFFKSSLATMAVGNTSIVANVDFKTLVYSLNLRVSSHQTRIGGQFCWS